MDLRRVLDFFSRVSQRGVTLASLAKQLRVKPGNMKAFKRTLNQLVSERVIIREGRRFRLSQAGAQRTAGRRKEVGGRDKGRLRKGVSGFVVEVSRGRGKKAFPVAVGGLNGAKAGELVAFRMPEKKAGQTRAPEVSITATLSAAESFAEVSRGFLRENKLKPGFSHPVQREVAAQNYDQVWKGEGRRDMRNEPVIVIDPPGARDHDDALSLTTTSRGTRLLTVHIADVSSFVPVNSRLDKEARNRSFTNYLPWTAVPMLPEKLSADLCSLKEGQDRAALSCRMELDEAGALLKYDFFESRIRVTEFLTYEQAQERMEKGEKYLVDLAEFTGILHDKRLRDGYLEFELPDPQVHLDKEGAPHSIQLTKRCDSYQWIEECMLLANQCAAKFLHKRHLPGLYRIHEPPEPEDLEELIKIESIIDARVPKKEGRGRSRVPTDSPAGQRELYRKLLEHHRTSIEGESGFEIQRMILRSMKKAQYSPQRIGHFALGWKDYAHFTSPIRRYADLWNHRLIKMSLRGKKIFPSLKNEAEHLGLQVTEAELVVQKVERKGTRTAAAWILRDFVGDEFKGVINGFDSYGIYVLIHTDRIYAEGWVSLSKLKDDYYEYDEEKLIIVGRRKKKQYQLRQSVKIRVDSVDPVSSKVDFDLLEQF